MRIVVIFLVFTLSSLLMVAFPLSANADKPDERIVPNNEMAVGITAGPLPTSTDLSPEPEQKRNMLDPNKPMVALTFDDGPTKTTLKILGLLEQYEGRGTFFMVGYMAEANPDIVKKVVEQGSEVGNHTWDHPSLVLLSEDGIRTQISRTNNAVYNAAGIYPTLLRPPYGNFNNTVTSIASEYGLAVIYWSVDTRDWATRNASATHNAIMDSVQDGSIILTHDLHAETGAAMESVIPALVGKGYQLVTVSELLGRYGGAPAAGTVYYSGPKKDSQLSIGFAPITDR